MTLRIRRILVALRDPRHPLRSQLRKAGTLARAAGARVELFHAINEPLALGTLETEGSARSLAQTQDRITTRMQQRLERLAASPLLKGVKVSTSALWDYPPYEAVIRRASAIGADLVIAATERHGTGARMLLANNDWELIRHCPCALLLVKSPRDYVKPAVIASVDPFHAHAKPARLDDRILDAADSLVRMLRGELHVFHAYMPLSVIAPGPGGPLLAVSLPTDYEDMHSAQVQSAFNSLAKDAGVPQARRHLRMGAVPDQLAGVVKRTRAGLVVMGAVSRSGLRRLFIGNTAETVLDALTCDALVIKPQGFKTTVPKRLRPMWVAE